MRRLLPVLQVLLSCVMLVWIYLHVPIADVLGTLADARRADVALGLGGVLALQFLVTLRWREILLAQGMGVGFGPLFWIQLSALFYKLFLPGGMITSVGVRFLKMSAIGVSRSGAISSIAVDRTLATFGLALVGAIAYAIDRPPLPAAVGWALVGWAFAMVVLLASMLHAGSAAVVRRLLVAARMGALAERTDRLFRSLAPLRNLNGRSVGRLALFTILPHLAGICIYAVLGSAVGIRIDLAAWGWVRAAVSILTTQPISVAGLGVREASLTWLLGALGVEQERALAMATLFLAVGVLAPAIAGGVDEAMRGLRSVAQRRKGPSGR